MLATAATATQTPNRTPIYALLAAEAISEIGNRITLLAVPWFVLSTTGSAARTSVVAFATVAPTVLASVLGGALVDRVGNKRMSIIADVMSGLTVAMVPLLFLTVGLTFFQLILLAFLGALLDAPGGTARVALVPDLAENSGMSLERINSASQVIYSSATLLGPPIAGGLIALMGPSKVLWIDAASFGISALIMAAFIPGSKPVVTERGHYFADVFAGLRFLYNDKLLWTILITAAATNFLFSPVFSVLLPYFAKNTYGNASDLGFMIGAAGAGAIAGAVLFGSLGRKLSKRLQLIACFGLLAFPMFILATSPPLWVTVCTFAVSGLASGGINPLVITVIQERSPEELRARVFGGVTATALVASPLGILLGGVGIETFGVTTVSLVIACMFLLVAGWFAVQPALKELDETKQPAPSAETADVVG